MDGANGGAERRRLAEAEARVRHWKRWGPYLAERQWGTVREDYSADGHCWEYFPHEHARSRAYRWGEDGLLGFCDRQCRLCFALALWNGRDPILKERLFGLSGPEGNHGEDVKELYFYLEATPVYSYVRGLYKYPQRAFPYAELVRVNRAYGRQAGEYEILDTGVFDGGRYFDVTVEYAKASPDDILIRITASNRGPEAADLHLLPTLWFRNTWSWGCEHEGCTPKPMLKQVAPGLLEARHDTLGALSFAFDEAGEGLWDVPQWLFTENESNAPRLWGRPAHTPYVKDAFHACVVEGRKESVNPARRGTKAAVHLHFRIPAGESRTARARLFPRGEKPEAVFGGPFEALFEVRGKEADEFYAGLLPAGLKEEERRVGRQAYAGLLWSKQFYHFSVRDWLKGDPQVMTPPPSRWRGRNAKWLHLFNRDVLSVPDKWEYPWFAAWDLAFHMIPFAHLDPAFAKEQLLLLLREWYMHPNGQIPAYEFAFDDVNPPVHAWACWRVYKMTGARGARDLAFLERAFHKLLMNFTWWVNRKDPDDNNIFSGGFLGLDNIGVFDRSRPWPSGYGLAQADGTAWMAFYCVTMLEMAMELARSKPCYEDVASKFFEHFVAIADAINSFGGSGLWDEEDGFYYDQLHLEDGLHPLKIRSLVGLVPLFAVMVLHEADWAALPGFQKRMTWFLTHRKDLARQIAWMTRPSGGPDARLLAIPSPQRLKRLLRYLFDENEFLSPFGIRGLSRFHRGRPYTFRAGGAEQTVRYTPGESDEPLFGGNSNWRGPVWFPMNYLILESLERYHHFFGEDFKVEFPAGSGNYLTLNQAARELARRLIRLFLPGPGGRRPCHGAENRYAHDPYFKDLLLFHEYFHGDTGMGLGASHQTGWTALVVKWLEDLGAAP